MEKSKKTKIIIVVSYFLLLLIFVILFLSKFSIQEIKSFTNFQVIKDNFSRKNIIKD